MSLNIMGQQNMSHSGPMLDVEPQQVHHHPEPYNNQTILPPPGNRASFNPRYMPENHGQLPVITRNNGGEYCNTFMIPTPNAGGFLVPVNQDHLSFSNNPMYERNRGLFMDGPNGVFKGSSSSVAVPMNGAMGFDPAVVHNNSHMVHGGQPVQVGPTPWLDQHNATGIFLWNPAHGVPFPQGGINGMEGRNMGVHGYQVAAMNRNAAGFIHSPGAHLYHPTPLPVPSMPPIQTRNMDVYSQIASASHRRSASGITTNHYQNGVVLGPRFVGPSPPTGLRLYEIQRRELMIEQPARRHSYPLRAIPADVEELLALSEQIGNGDSGLTDNFIADHLKTKTFALSVPSHSEDPMPAEEPNFCVICQMEFEDQERIGMLDCCHDYHEGCIKRWLIEKNNCPICKSKALP